jgi:hypothetical protein
MVSFFMPACTSGRLQTSEVSETSEVYVTSKIMENAIHETILRIFDY